MNTNLGLIGKKVGNMQYFNDDGSVRRVTVIETGPCVVVGKRTSDKDGYSALQLGFGKKTEKRLSQSMKGLLKKIEKDPVEVIREFRVNEDVLGKYEIGQEIKASDIFGESQFVDVSGTSKGRGFTGVMKRHNFKGSKSMTHGAHEYKRHGGSIGMNMTPGRTFKNQKMPGQHGSVKVTTLNLKIAKVRAEDNLVLIDGSVPGPRNGIVTLKLAVKKKQASVVETS